jgi:hypothetical protein
MSRRSLLAGQISKPHEQITSSAKNGGSIRAQSPSWAFSLSGEAVLGPSVEAEPILNWVYA